MDCIGFRRFGTGWHGHWLAALVLLCLGSWMAKAAPAPATTTRSAAPARPKPAPDGQRFLFVVDISSAMRDTDAANRQALFDMLFTGLDGQMRTGDTFGLWFYNDKLHAGTFPMQIWDEQDPLPVASLATKYLREQQYSGRSRPDVLMPPLLNLIRSVRDVNVLVISLGKPVLQGTPFDTNIVALVKRKRSERESAQKPFVTALVARDGAIVNGAVIIPGEELRLPDRPRAIMAAKAATNSIAPPPKPKGVVHSLSTSEYRIQGSELRKPDTTPAARTSEPGTATSKPEPGTPNPEPGQTAATLTAQPVAQLEPPKPKVLQFVTRSNVVATNITAALAPSPTVPAPATNQTSTVPKPSSGLAKTAVEPGTRNPESRIASAPTESGATSTNLQTRPQASVSAAPSSPVATTVAGLVKALEPELIPVAAREPATTAPSAATVAVATPPPGPSAVLLLTIGVVLLAACLGLLLVVLRKLRPQRQGSFITRSMELR